MSRTSVQQMLRMERGTAVFRCHTACLIPTTAKHATATAASHAQYLYREISSEIVIPKS